MDLYEPDEPTAEEIELFNATIKSVEEGLISAAEAADILQCSIADIRYWIDCRQPEQSYEALADGDLPF